MKKTIEEVAQDYLRNTDINPFSAINDGFIAGAKYQSEQMYSEEEVINILIKRDEVIDSWYNNGLGYNYPRTNEWFNQYKKS